MSSTLRSKIKYKKPDKDSYDAKRVSHILCDEFGQMGKVDLPKGFMFGTLDDSGNIKPLIFPKPKNKKK